MCACTPECSLSWLWCGVDVPGHTQCQTPYSQRISHQSECISNQCGPVSRQTIRMKQQGLPQLRLWESLSSQVHQTAAWQVASLACMGLCSRSLRVVLSTWTIWSPQQSKCAPWVSAHQQVSQSCAIRGYLNYGCLLSAKQVHLGQVHISLPSQAKWSESLCESAAAVILSL